MTQKKNGIPMVVFDKWGPYMVVGKPKLTNSKGEELSLDNVASLCRCGESKNKPYCDGSHGPANFSGEKESDRREDKVIEYEGKEITILDNRGVCSADGACVRESPNVFNKDKKPAWIFPDEDSVRRTIETIEKCPSGALSYKIGTQRIQNLDRAPAIKVAKNGPLEFVGWIKLIDDMGSKPESLEHYTLCRCGASKNKPFCDNRHKKIEFKDEKN
ncbi:MAG: CDGSH iron-sulfur domain-containing protein [Candidatus Thorarchaeota archaeon]